MEHIIRHAQTDVASATEDDWDPAEIARQVATLPPARQRLVRALFRAWHERAITLDEFGERFASGGYAGIEELLVERGLLDGEAQR